MKYQEFRQFLFELAKNYAFQKDAQTPFTLDEISQILKSKQSEIENSISGRLLNTSYKFFNTENQRKNLMVSLRSHLFGNIDNRGKVRKGELIKWLEQPVQTRIFEISDKLQTELGLLHPRIEITNDTLKSLTNFNKTADYFEKIVSQRVREILLTYNHPIIEAYSNLEIARTNDIGKITAEYDVLCVTNKGTIIALDAKTFEFTGKDIDARLFNLQEGSGFYKKFSVVIPLDFDDVDTGFIPTETINLAFNLKKKKLDFFVVSNHSKESSYWIGKTASGYEKSLQEPDNDDWIECRPLTKAIT